VFDEAEKRSDKEVQTFSYAKLCRENGWDVKDMENDGRVELQCRMGWLRQIKLSRKDQELAAEQKLPKAAGFRYSEMVEKAVDRKTEKQQSSFLVMKELQEMNDEEAMRVRANWFSKLTHKRLCDTVGGHALQELLRCGPCGLKCNLSSERAHEICSRMRWSSSAGFN
jgi:hypothetical protein